MKARLMLSISLLIIVVLLLPLIFKDKGHVHLKGPDLSGLEYTEISFDNTVENFKLAGMLFLPEGEGPFPTAILIHGSGPSFRNSVWYLSVAKHLQDNGIAVLLPDKRGCEKSEGKWLGANFEALANDVIAAVDFVKNQNIFECSSIGIVGMSQGGWIAPIAAAKSSDIDFVAVVSGSSVTTDEQLLYEEVNNISAYTYKFIAKLLAPLTTKRIKKLEHFRPLAGFDPIYYWKKVNVPVFFGFGENDKNVPVDKSIERLKENNLNNFKIRSYPNGGHAIMDVHTQKMNQEYLNDLAGFIKEVKR